MRRLAATLLILCALVAGPSTAVGARSPGARGHGDAPREPRPPRLPDDLALAAAQAHVEREVGDYVAWRAGVDATLVAVADTDAFLRSLYVPPPPPDPPSDVGQTYVSGDGSCYGGPIPDYIVTRESGGDPTALNPSGAWGCYQIMPEWWSGACAGFDRYTIDGQKQCAALIWDGGAGAGNWSETR